MAYQYDEFLAPLNTAKELLPKVTKRRQERIGNDIKAIKTNLFILKSYIENTENNEYLDRIKTEIQNIPAYIEKSSIDKLEERCAYTLKLLHATINQYFSSIFSAYGKVNDVVAQIQESGKSATEGKEQIKNAYSTVEQILNQIRESEKSATTGEVRITDAYSTVEQTLKKVAEIKDKIENMQHDAGEIISDKTSVALAQSFKSRKDQLTRRIRVWGVVLFLSLIFFIGLGYLYITEIDSITKMEPVNAVIALILRLAIFIPVSWGVIVSSKKLAETIRLEEGYSHKEVLLTSFTGFKTAIKQTENINSEMYISKLINKALDVTSKDPDYVFVKSTSTEKNQGADTKENQDTDIEENQGADTEENQPSRETGNVQ